VFDKRTGLPRALFEIPRDISSCGQNCASPPRAESLTCCSSSHLLLWSESNGSHRHRRVTLFMRCAQLSCRSRRPATCSGASKKNENTYKNNRYIEQKQIDRRYDRYSIRIIKIHTHIKIKAKSIYFSPDKFFFSLLWPMLLRRLTRIALLRRVLLWIWIRITRHRLRWISGHAASYWIRRLLLSTIRIRRHICIRLLISGLSRRSVRVRIVRLHVRLITRRIIALLLLWRITALLRLRRG